MSIYCSLGTALPRGPRTYVQAIAKREANVMPLPISQLFEEFLAATRLVRERTGRPFVEFTPKSQGMAEATTLFLEYPDTELKLSSILRRIESELRALGGAADESVALAVLGLVAESRVDGVSWVEHANRCIAKTHESTLSQFAILPSEPTSNYRITREQYSLNAFDPTRLLYWASRGGSSYPIDLRALAGQFCIELAPRRTALIHWDEVPGYLQIVGRWGEQTALTSILDVYYQAVAEYFLNGVPDLVEDDLAIYEAGSLMRVAVRDMLNSMFTNRVSLFHWKGGAGHRSWALLSAQRVLHTNFYPAKLFDQCTSWLANELGFHAFSGDKPIDAAIRTYARFLQRAHEHRLKERPDESFLHFVIALDLLLGSEGRSSESVCQRGALLVHRQLGNTLTAQLTVLKRIYDRRSKYVHEGKSPTADDLRDAERVCTEILWNLLASLRLNRFASIDSWLSHIDLLLATLKASREVPEEELLALGLPAAGVVRVAPNRVER
jgi:hypothetical protein